MKNINNIKKTITGVFLFIFLPYISLCSDISFYKFKINFDTLERKLNVDLIISIKKTEITEKFLLSDDASINDITINNKHIKFNHINDTLTFTDNPSESQEIHIFYKLPVDSFKTNSDIIILRRENRWYPVVYNNIFDCQIIISDLHNYYTIASGEKSEKKDELIFNANKIQTIPLFLLSKNKFKKEIISNNNLVFYSEKGDTTNKNKFYQLFEESFKFYTELFQREPFYGKFEIIEIPEVNVYLCQSLRNIIIYGKPFLNMYLINNYNWISHETAHQWWALNVQFNSKKENYWFMSEAITEYLKTLYVEKKQGADEMNKLIKTYITAIEQNITKDNDVAISDIKDVFLQNTGILMYNKGPLIMCCLSKKIGEENLLKILTTLYSKNIYSSIDYQTFLSLLR